jgi:RNA polymerase sigma-70 factor, ECF subfamily
MLKTMTLPAGELIMPLPERSMSPAGMSEHSDSDLLAAINRRDHAAFENLLRRHFNYAFKIAARMLGDAHEAEDVAQEIFLKLWANPKLWQPGKGKFSTWVYRVSANASIDRMRRKRFEPIEMALSKPDEGLDPESAAFNSQLRARVKTALDQLPPRQKLAVVLTHYQGCSNKESAQIMDIHVDGLESLLVRARRKLKQLLSDDWQIFLPSS